MENQKGMDLDDVELDWDYKLFMIVYGILIVLMVIWYVRDFVLK